MVEGAFPNRAQFKAKKVASPRLVLVLGQLGAACKLRWVFTPLLHRLKEGDPGLMQLDEDLIGYFGRKSLIGIGFFQQTKRGDIIQVSVLEDEGLPDVIVCQIPQVFRGKGHFIDRLVLGMILFYNMLLNPSHASASCAAGILPINACVRLALLWP